MTETNNIELWATTYVDRTYATRKGADNCAARWGDLDCLVSVEATDDKRYRVRFDHWEGAGKSCGCRRPVRAAPRNYATEYYNARRAVLRAETHHDRTVAEYAAERILDAADADPAGEYLYRQVLAIDARGPPRRRRRPGLVMATPLRAVRVPDDLWLAAQAAAAANHESLTAVIIRALTDYTTDRNPK